MKYQIRVSLAGLPRRSYLPLLQRVALVALLLAPLAACSIFPYQHGTYANQCGERDLAVSTPASLEPTEIKDGVFIGISMSGGGSRAANFSAAVLLELSGMGLLDDAAVISSVSGSSLTAAYYAMYGRDPTRWNEESVRRTMIYDFDRDWTMRWLYPQNIARYWFTAFDRSDIMKNVFDDVLFPGARKRVTFGQLDPPGTTRILINATEIAGGENFVFADQTFRDKVGSRLDEYPVSHAIMASAAFPAVFNAVTLRDFAAEAGDGTAPRCAQTSRGKRFRHLYDGGPSGNLGVNAVVNMLHASAAKQELKACLLVLVDAYPLADAKIHKGQNKDDLRSLWGFLVDENLMDAFDDLLRSQRQEALRGIGFPREKQVGSVSAWEYRPVWQSSARRKDLTCSVWHISLQYAEQQLADTEQETAEHTSQKDPQLRALQQAPKPGLDPASRATISDAELSRQALNIATDFRLVHPALGDAFTLQNVLFSVAKERVRSHPAEVRQWLQNWRSPGGVKAPAAQ